MDRLNLLMWKDAPELSHRVLKKPCFVCGIDIDVAHEENIILSVGAYCDKHTFADVLEKELNNCLDGIIKNYVDCIHVS